MGKCRSSTSALPAVPPFAETATSWTFPESGLPFCFFRKWKLLRVPRWYKYHAGRTQWISSACSSHSLFDCVKSVKDPVSSRIQNCSERRFEILSSLPTLGIIVLRSHLIKMIWLNNRFHVKTQRCKDVISSLPLRLSVYIFKMTFYRFVEST